MVTSRSPRDQQVSHTEKSNRFINCEAFNKDSKAFHELAPLAESQK
jgi:hypothetical protein